MKLPGAGDIAALYALGLVEAAERLRWRVLGHEPGSCCGGGVALGGRRGRHAEGGLGQSDLRTQNGESDSW